MWHKKTFPVLFLFFLAGQFHLAQPALATLEGETSVLSTSFAGSNTTVQQLNLNLHLKSETLTPPQLLRLDVKGFGHLELGPEGDQSLDLDPAVLRVSLWEKSHFWLGRTHPFTEGIASEFSSDYPNNHTASTSALSTHWVKNQSLPLHPRVSGWVGGGFKLYEPKSGMFFLASYSPLFLPGFGVRTQLSEESAPNGSRFARLPPHFLKLNENTTLPLRYRVEIPSKRSILQQDQAFISLGKHHLFGTFAVMAWNSPAPDPELEITGNLQFKNDEPIGLVTVRPHFVRRTCAGFSWDLSSQTLSPNFQTVHDFKSNNTTFSFSLSYKNKISTGFLHTLEREMTSSSLPVSSPQYAKKLFWLELSTFISKLSLQPTIRWERHLTTGEEDDWIEAILNYQPVSNLSLFAALNILSGQDRSYYGAWRSLDSLATGLKLIW